jgi:DNA polymerase-3 subunit beta
MKLSTLQENLADTLSIVSRVVGSQSNLPILENILFKTTEKGLKISGTDLETGISIIIPADIKEEGSITLPAKRITSFVSSLPSGNVIFEKKGEKLSLECKKYHASFNGISAEDFPDLPSLQNKETQKSAEVYHLQSGQFVNAVEKVIFAAAADETRPVLNGVLVSSNSKQLQLVATDGYRLSLKKIGLDEELQLPEMLIPAKALQEVARIFPQDEKEFELAITSRENQVIFSFEDMEIVTRLIEGQFPEFEKIIPDQGKTKCEIETEPLEKAVRATAIFAKESANIMRFRSEDNDFIVEANAPEVGENRTAVEMEKDGADFKIAFNWRFLQDFLNVIESETILFEVSEALKPGLFKTEDDPDFIHVIMPVRVQD